MSRERIATVDEVHTALIREAFEDAGIEVSFQSPGALQQVQVQQLVSRPMVDVVVESAQREAALALLDEITRGGEEAALAEAERSAPPDDAPSGDPAWRRGLNWLLGDSRKRDKDDGSQS